MQVSDVPDDPRSLRAVLTFAPLLYRAEVRSRSSWIALSAEAAWRKKFSGIYVIRWPQECAPVFLPTAGKALHATPTAPEDLVRRWRSIEYHGATDVVYVGKGECLRDRLRTLAMFGVGRRRNHVGGEWLWQIQGVEAAEVVLITCPLHREVGFENSFLERFEERHNDYPLANRYGPKGPDRWWPGDPS